MAVGALVLLEADSAGPVVMSAVRAMPAPATPVEELLLRGVLFDFAIRSGEGLHRRVCHRGAPCSFVPASLLPQFWTGPEAARDAFAAWIDALVVQLRLAHPLSPAARVAQLIRADHRGARTVTDYARDVHISPSSLRRGFQKQFGMSVARYRRMRRLLAALESVHTDKLDALALHVGYRSKKSFYAAFRQLTGVTPGAYRQLPPAEAKHLVSRLRVLIE